MSFMGGITDFLTGGKNQDAEDALKKAEQGYSSINVPTAQQLTLPELQQYVQAGLMTPAQAAAALQSGNAYDSISTDPRARQASEDALAKLQSIGDAGGQDAQSQAATAAAESKMNQTTQSQRASIMDQMDQRGIPSSLMSVAEQLGAAGQDAEQAHTDALQAASDAQTRALQAIEAGGTLGNTVEAQQNTEAAQKAAAQNAIDQWNAANQTTVNLNNSAQRQQAASYNAQVAQNTSNANIQNANSRTAYNANLPQTVYNDQMTKANGLAGVYTNEAGQYQHEGNQNAGTAGALINLAAPQPFTGQSAGSTVSGGSAPAPSMAGGGAGGAGAMSSFGGEGAAGAGGSGAAADAVMLASKGGVVPGIPKMPGDSPANDTQPALLSPGEVVVPRSKLHTPQTALSFIKHMHRQTAQSPAHPDDIKSVLHALGSMRSGGM